MTLEEVRALVEALQRKLTFHDERLAELEDENDDLRERVAELERVVDTDPGRGTYEELSKDRKVYRVRVAVAKRAAESSNNRGAMTYKDVYWLFDGHPSYGHCYDLMARAAELGGFEYDTSGDTPNRITSNFDAVNDETVIHAVKKELGGVGA